MSAAAISYLLSTYLSDFLMLFFKCIYFALCMQNVHLTPQINVCEADTTSAFSGSSDHSRQCAEYWKPLSYYYNIGSLKPFTKIYFLKQLCIAQLWPHYENKKCPPLHTFIVNVLQIQSICKVMRYRIKSSRR